MKTINKYLSQIETPLLLLLSFTLLTFSTFGPAEARALKCKAAFDPIPNGDLVYEWTRESLGEYRRDLRKLNAVLRPEQRFSEADLEKAIPHLAYHLADEVVVLRQMIGFYDKETGWLTNLKDTSQWKEFAHQWLQEIIQRPLPSREILELKESQSYHQRAMRPLNVIEQRRREIILAQVKLAEQRVGQPLFSPDYLEKQANWSSRDTRHFELLLKDLRLFPKVPDSFRVADWRDQLIQLGKTISNVAEHSFSSDALLLAIANRPEYHEEVLYYLERLKEERWFGGAYLIVRRLEGIIRGEATFQDSVHGMLAEKIVESYQTYNSTADQFGGFGAGDSLRTTMARDPLRRNTHPGKKEKFDKDLKELRSQNVKVKYLGQLSELNHTVIFGKLMDKNPNYHTYMVFAAEVTFANRVQHLALLVDPSFRGETVPEGKELSREFLMNLHVRDIRETQKPARIGDAFATVPVDLAEPMLKLTPSSVVGTLPFKSAVDTMFVRRRPLSESEKSAQTVVELKENSILSFGKALFSAATLETGNELVIRLYNGSKQAVPNDLILPLKSDKGGTQIFELKIKAGALQQVIITVIHNPILNKYIMTTRRQVTALGFTTTTSQWSGTFAP